MLLYLACEKSEHVVHWYDDLYTLHSNLNEVISLFDNHVADLVELVLDHWQIEGNYEIYMCLSDNQHNFRKLIYPEYKANRGERRRPITYNAMREWIQENYHAVLVEWLEADDCIGLLANETDTIIISGDKDMRTIPSKFYDFSRNIFYEADKTKADEFHLLQTLTGDATDNYKGCPNIGETRAERFLSSEGYSWKTVVETYRNNGSTEEEALMTARLAFILRKGYYDKKNKRIRLWSPKTKKKDLPILELKEQEGDF